MNKRAVIYARVSTDMQRDNFSIPSQISECILYASSRNYTIVGNMYVDPETGFDTGSGNGAIPAFVDDYTSRELSRPGFDAILDYLESMGFDILLVHAIDRLARDPYIRQTLEREVQKRGAKIEYALGSYEETPEGEVRKDLDATFAKWENARRVERSTRGKRSKAQKGLFVGGRTPFGYALNPNAPGGLEVIEEEAKVVRKIFELYVFERKSLRDIVKDLETIGAKTKLGRSTWQRSSISTILTNPVYAGIAHYNKFKNNNNNERQLRPRDEWIEIKVAPLVDKDLFERAQESVNENRDGLRKRPQHFYLLNGRVLCDDCDHPYLATFRNARPEEQRKAASAYRHRKSEGHCMNRSISARQLEPLVWEKVRDFLKDPKRLEEGRNQALELEQSNRIRQRTLHEQLQRMVGKLEKQLQNLTSAYTDPDIQMTKAEYLAQRSQIEAELKSVGERMQKIETELSALPTPEEYVSLERFAEEIRLRLGDDNGFLRPEDQKKVLELLNAKVRITRDYRIAITGWFGELEGVTYNVY